MSKKIKNRVAISIEEQALVPNSHGLLPCRLRSFTI